MNQLKFTSSIVYHDGLSLKSEGISQLSHIDMTCQSTEQKIRVMHITFGLDVGGLEKLLVEIAKHTHRGRFDLRFVSLGNRGSLADSIEKHGWPVVAMEEADGLRPRLIPRLANLMRQMKFDVVHTHNTRALVYGGPAAKLARCRLIHTWHGRNLTGSKREDLLFRLLRRLPDHIVAVSADAAGFLREQGVPQKRLRTIINGIDVHQLAYHGPKADGPAIIVARLSPEKDIATLLRAISLARKNLPDIKLSIVGDGPAKNDLQWLGKSLGLDECVTFLGQRNDVPDLLAQSRLFVLSSLTEGISLTLLEAMATGLPVIATNVGGNNEVVDHGKTGLLVPANSPEALSRAIEQIWDESDLQLRMGKSGRSRVEQRFDIRRMVGEYESLYAEVLPSYYQSRANRSHFEKRRILTNMASLKDHATNCSTSYYPMTGNYYLQMLRFWLHSFDVDGVLVDQEEKLLFFLALSRWFVPLRQPELISLDLVLARPQPSMIEQSKAFIKRGIFRKVDLFLMHMKSFAPLRQCYGIESRRARYVPFKVNFWDEVRPIVPTERGYIFTGGRSRRDFKTFCEAMEKLPYQARIITPRPDELAEHGTVLQGIEVPENVTILHDDGSSASWLEQMAHSNIAVFCISPETISPSGVGAYLLAMALKKCVIVSDCPATRGILEHGKNALLVPMCDAVALQKTIRQVQEDDDLRHKIAQGGYRYAVSLGGDETLARNVCHSVISFLKENERRIDS